MAVDCFTVTILARRFLFWLFCFPPLKMRPTANWKVCFGRVVLERPKRSFPALNEQRRAQRPFFCCFVFRIFFRFCRFLFCIRHPVLEKFQKIFPYILLEHSICSWSNRDIFRLQPVYIASSRHQKRLFLRSIYTEHPNEKVWSFNLFFTWIECISQFKDISI